MSNITHHSVNTSEWTNIPLKTSEEWSKIVCLDGMIIQDPDGWDRSNWQFSWYEELIPEDEFKDRMFKSTIIYDKKQSEI